MWDSFFGVLMPGLALSIVLFILGFLICLFIIVFHLLMDWGQKRLFKVFDDDPNVNIREDGDDDE